MRDKSSIQAAAAQRTNLLSGPASASVDVRKACNGIKRMSALGAAAIVAGLEPKRAVAAAEQMATEVLVSIGFDVKDEARMACVLPMMLEATSLVLADAAYHADEAGLTGEHLAKVSKLGVAVLSEVAKSRAVAKMIEPGYPADVDAVVSLRLSAAAAMAHVAVEVVDFDFAHDAGDCVREAGKVIVKAALAATAELAPAQASPAARQMLTQSLIHSAARVYGAAWRVVSSAQVSELDALGHTAREVALETMEKTSLAQLLAPVNARFVGVFKAVAQVAADVFADGAAEIRPGESRPAQPIRPR